MAIEDEMKDVQQLVVNQLGVANGLNNSLADGQVTADKLATDSVTATKIEDGQVTSDKLSTDSVTTTKIADGHIPPSKLSAGGPTWGGEALTINGTGSVGGLEINSDVSGTGTAFIDFHSTSATNPDYDARIINTDTGEFQFINTAGQFAFNLGQDLGTFGLYDGDSFKIGVAAGTEGGLKCSRQGTAATNQISFLNPNGQVGFINTQGTTTVYGTSSDYRLKEDITSIDNSIERLNQLKPCNFAWKVDGTRVDGFIAHEVQEVVPIAATGTKDAVKEDGTPDYQGIDQAKLVPLLTAALQEALTKIEALEVRITALEA